MISKSRSKRKILSLFVIIVMLMSLMPMAAWAEHTPMTVTSNAPEFTVDVQEEFTVTTVANDDAGKLVRAHFTVPSEVTNLEYQEQNPGHPSNGQWFPLGDVYGPTTGFPVMDATSNFRATFNAPGTYTVGVEFRAVEGGAVVGSHNVVIVVAAPEPQTYSLTLEANPIAGGTVTGGGSYVAWIDVPVTATPNPGYVFVNWTDGDLIVSDHASFDYQMSAGDITLVANFSQVLSANADLNNLVLSNGTINFSSATTSYSVNVANSVSSITVTPTKADPGATIRVNGTAVTSGSASAAISLSVGANTITILVTAEDGSTTKTYTVTVNRASATTGGGGGGGGGGGTTTPPTPTTPQEPTTTPTEGTTATVGADSVVKEVSTTEDGKTVETFTVTEDAKEQIAQAKEAGKTSVEIKVDSAAAVAVVKIPSAVVQGAEGLAVQIATPKAAIQLPKELVEAIAKSGQDIAITVQSGSADVVRAEMSNVGGTEGATVLGTPTVINTDIRGNTTVSLPLAGISLPTDAQARESFLNSLAVFVVHSDGDKKVATGNIVFDQNNNPVSISFNVDKFSTFAIIKLPEKKTVSLTDISGHWAKANIDKLIAVGAITGYPDNTFRPNNNITRAEFATVLVKAFGLEVKPGKVFNDTANHWAKDIIATAAAHGIVAGLSETTFGPNELITREQMAVMVVRASNLSLQSGDLPFVDSSDISSWAVNGVATAAKEGLITGYPDNTFKPRGNATRAEAATVIIKAINN